MTSSENSQTSSGTPGRDVLLVLCGLVVLVASWAWWTLGNGYLLYYGDAQAHLNNSRSLLDSRTPGYDQLGTVWLPMLHVLCLPFVQNTALWSSGLAGTIPVSLCFVFTGLFLYLSVSHVHQSSLPAVIVLGCFALNPNVLYLSVITMTELVFLAGLSALVYSAVCYRSFNRPSMLGAGLLASWWMSLTRYDGWFLIPFAAAWFASSARSKRLAIFFGFSAAASLAPLYWVANSWWLTSNPLDFFNGPYSAKAIQHGAPYPGFHDWPNAFLYYAKAAQLCSGWALVALALLGLLSIRTNRVLAPTLFLLLPCVFYVWSIHSSGNPIHVPQLPPFSYYNTRYGIAFTFFAAFATSSFVASLQRIRPFFAVAVLFIAVLPWLMVPTRENWICWKESEHNSDSRRSWTAAAVAYLESNYRPGQGIVAPFGDVCGIFCRARIPLAHVLHEGDGPSWEATIRRPDLLHTQEWAVAQQGDVLDRALSGPHRNPYLLVRSIGTKDSPALHIYRRQF